MTPIVGNNIDWLIFWASYLGLIVAIIIPTTVCYLSLKENRLSRKEQIKKELLQQFKDACLKCGTTYLPQNISEIPYYCIDFEDIQRVLKAHRQQVSQVHLNFLIHTDENTSETMSLLECSCYEWHNNLLNDAFSIVKGVLIDDKESFKKYINNHKFHKSIPNVDTIIDDHFNKGKYVFVLMVLGALIKQYLTDTSDITRFLIEINRVVSFKVFVTEMNNISID